MPGERPGIPPRRSLRPARIALVAATLLPPLSWGAVLLTGTLAGARQRRCLLDHVQGLTTECPPPWWELGMALHVVGLLDLYAAASFSVMAVALSAWAAILIRRLRGGR